MKKFFTFLAGICAFASVEAQVIYSCDFETPSENAQWTVNQISSQKTLSEWKNIWRIGAPGNCAQGNAGLYICTHTDTANTSISSTTTDFIVSYRDGVNLGAAGTYTLNFDWRALGKNGDALYVYWIPSTYTKNTNSAVGAASLPAALEGFKIASVTGLRGSAIWKSYSGNFTSTTATGKLMFLWYQTAGAAVNPPAALDNIEITQPSSCAAPTGLTYNPAGSISWNGSASSYDVRYNNTHTDEWTVVNGVTGKTCQLANITEGTYTFQVRSNCGGSHSSWTTISQFIWIAGLRCIDYFDYGADATSKGRCTVGHHTNTESHSSLVWDATPQVVDYGPSSPQSMHTLHTEVGEVDPNTTVNGGLRTIPEGEIASIRLGAYTDSGEDARIEYRYKVQRGMSDLLDLHYACVLESGGHSDDNPFFQLDILDQRGHQISGCTHAYFVADMSSSGTGWHQEGSGGNGTIYWCDWRTVTVSLTEFVGQTLTIRLTSSRCVFDTHFGYAYFTLNCRSGGLQGVACGDFSTDHFVAPSGFNYQWYKLDEPGTILGTDSVFNISNNDTTIYAVKVISRLGDNCYYVLTANPNPRFPETKVSYSVYQEDCENYVRFRNSSDIVIVNRLDSSTVVSDDVVEDIIWDFGDGSPVVHSTDSVVVHKFPKSGGLFNVKVSASMNGGICTDEKTYPINVPVAGDWIVETTDTICYGESVTFFGVKYSESGVYTKDHGKRVNNCDSLSILNLTVLPELKSTRADSIICYGDTVRFGKTTISKSGTYTEAFPSVNGCDSTVTWKVDVADPILPNVDVTPIVEDGDLGAFDITGTGYTYYTINGVRHEVTDHSIVGLTPDTYLLIFYNAIGCEKALTFDLGQGCVANFVYQRWNYVLSVKNPTYANGRSYVKYQWIEDGLPIPGATKSYYYADAGLNFDAVYEVQLTDSLGNEYLTCPYKPIKLINDGPSLSPSSVQRGGNVWLQTDTKTWVECYNTSGLKMFSSEVEAGSTSFEMPMQSGMYIVTAYTEDGKKSFRVCVTD